MRNTDPIDKVEGDSWSTEANRRIKRWLAWTLLLLAVAYFIPLRWAALLALFYARLADPDLNLGDLPFAFPLPFLFRPHKRNTIFATSVVLKDKATGDTRARLHVLENGEPALSLYSESGDETAAFTSTSRGERIEEMGELNTRVDGLATRAEDQAGELQEANAALQRIQARVERLEEERQREREEMSERVSSRSFELLDEDGKVRARLHPSRNQPHLALYDRNGVSRASLHLGDNGCPEFFLTNLYTNSPSPTKGGGSRCSIALGFDDEGYPQLQMYDDPDPAVGGTSPALSLAVSKAEWEGQQNVRYWSKTAGLSVRAYGRGGEKAEFFGARIAETTADHGA